MKIYNTLTRMKEEFIPLEPGTVKLYACGPTVYDYFHIGNGRMFVTFDTLRNYLEHKKYRVIMVQNFTDIDDKMINRAAAEGVTVAELAGRFIEAYFEDAEALGVKKATFHPKATEHMPQMIRLIETLADKGLAYESRGDVYFDTQAYSGYGKLSGQNLEDLESGARVATDESKKHPMDFALWKAQKPGEPAWESPWGPGRPGWHIECSAMSMEYLGETIDIHGGGQDLVFPHHENELAQSEGATGKPFVKYWMHNGFLQIDNEKMAKSVGNFVTVRDIRKLYDPEAVRFFLLSAHYRSPLNFSREQIEQAKAALERLYTARENYLFLLGGARGEGSSPGEQALREAAKEAIAKFDAAMDDDLNTADALGVLFALVKRANIGLASGASAETIRAVLDAFDTMTGVLGLVKEKSQTQDEYTKDEASESMRGGISGKVQPSDTKAAALLSEREDARKNRNWARSDEIRDELKAMGYAVEDTKQGQKVRKV